MNLSTTRFGRIDVPLNAVLTFPSGLQGFPLLRRFVLLKTTELGLFRWLQSADVPSIACLVCNPRLVVHDYAIRVPARSLADLHISSAEQADLLVIVSNPNDRSLMSVDLQRPIVLNRALRLARHLAPVDSAWSLAHRVFPDASVSSASPDLPAPSHPLSLSA